MKSANQAACCWRSPDTSAWSSFVAVPLRSLSIEPDLLSSMSWRAGLARLLIQCSSEDRQLVKALTAKNGLNTIGRKVTTFIVAIFFCASVFPIPVATIAVSEVDHSQRFPCQNGTCGCATAERCWTSCCCFTLAERLAWAERNGVAPPSYVQATPRDPKPRNKKSIRSEKTNCCATKATNSHASCCKPAKTDTIREERSSSSTKRKVVLGLSALKCQGKSSAFTSLPWTILATLEKVLVLEQEPGPAHLATRRDPAQVFIVPDTPPPKQLLS